MAKTKLYRSWIARSIRSWIAERNMGKTKQWSWIGNSGFRSLDYQKTIFTGLRLLDFSMKKFRWSWITKSLLWSLTVKKIAVPLLQWLSLLNNFIRQNLNSKCRPKSCLQRVGDSGWWGSLTMVLAGNKAKCLLLVNHTTKILYHKGEELSLLTRISL